MSVNVLDGSKDSCNGNKDMALRSSNTPQDFAWSSDAKQFEMFNR